MDMNYYKIRQQVIARAFRESVPVKPFGKKDQAQVEAQVEAQDQAQVEVEAQAQVNFKILSACAQGAGCRNIG